MSDVEFITIRFFDVVSQKPKEINIIDSVDVAKRITKAIMSSFDFADVVIIVSAEPPTPMKETYNGKL